MGRLAGPRRPRYPAVLGPGLLRLQLLVGLEPGAGRGGDANRAGGGRAADGGHRDRAGRESGRRRG